MKFEKKYKPELCASKDKTRAVLMACHVIDRPLPNDNTTPEEGERKATLEATDGRRLVRVPCILEAGDIVGNGIVPVAAIVAARKATKKSLTAQLILAEDNIRLRAADVVQDFPRDNGQKYPNSDAVIPGGDMQQCKDGRIGLNADLLCGMQEAMAAHGVSLSYQDHMSPIVVRPIADTRPGAPMACFGVLMSIRLA